MNLKATLVWWKWVLCVFVHRPELPSKVPRNFRYVSIEICCCGFTCKFCHFFRVHDFIMKNVSIFTYWMTHIFRRSCSDWTSFRAGFVFRDPTEMVTEEKWANFREKKDLYLHKNNVYIFISLLPPLAKQVMHFRWLQFFIQSANVRIYLRQSEHINISRSNFHAIRKQKPIIERAIYGA